MFIYSALLTLKIIFIMVYGLQYPIFYVYKLIILKNKNSVSLTLTEFPKHLVRQYSFQDQIIEIYKNANLK